MKPKVNQLVDQLMYLITKEFHKGNVSVDKWKDACEIIHQIQYILDCDGE